MKRRTLARACLFAGLLFLINVRPARALENEEKDAQEAAADRSIWKLVNTAIFFAGIGFLVYKKAPAFFNARSADIQHSIQEATGLKMNADLRYSEIDRKMATLSEEVNRLRSNARDEMEREHERIQRQTADDVRRIQEHTEQEIEASRLAGVRQVRRATAQSALALAESRLRERLTGTESDDQVHDFTNLVQRGKN